MTEEEIEFQKLICMKTIYTMAHSVLAENSAYKIQVKFGFPEGAVSILNTLIEASLAVVDEELKEKYGLR